MNKLTLEDLEVLFKEWWGESDFAISLFWEKFSQEGGDYND